VAVALAVAVAVLAAVASMALSYKSAALPSMPLAFSSLPPPI